MRKTVLLLLVGLMNAVPYAHADSVSPKVAIEHGFAVPTEVAWRALGRFCSISKWQSLVTDCTVEERKDGIYRFVGMRDGSAFTERLEEYSTANHAFTYSMVTGPLPVKNYRSELRLVPAGPRQTKLVWKAWYSVPPGGHEEAIATDLKALFGNGIKGMATLLEAQ